MPRGRPRKPTTLKILSGNPGGRPLPVEREVEHGAAEKPAWVAADILASAAWDDLAPERIALGLLTSVTTEAFGQLCYYLGEFRRDPKGLDGPARSDMRYLRAAFGYENSALAKLGIATPKPSETKNPFAVLSS